MAYPPRIFKSGYWYHVSSRGQRQEPLFFSPGDRIQYMQYLCDELRRRGGRLGSFCLMTNHVHLLLKMGDSPLDEIFRPAHMKYAKYFNNQRDTRGHVFQGRPGIRIVLDSSYLRTVVAYIHRNPVEADMVQDVTDFDWSSWPVFMGRPMDLIDQKIWEFPPGFEGRNIRNAFMESIQSTTNDLPGEDHFIGSESDWEDLDRREPGRDGGKYRERRGKTPKELIVKRVCKDLAVTERDLKGPSRRDPISNARRQAMALMYEAGYGPSEIGRYFNRTRSAVSHACRKWKR